MKRKTLWRLCFQLTCFTLAQECFSLPKEPQVAHGSVEVKQVDSSTMEIHPSDQAIINYSAFDIATHEKVRFIQNAHSSCVLNRVVGSDPSQIFGSLESNGKVFLVNPNGVYFGPDSTVNVGSFIVSTLDITDKDFLEENYHFSLTKSSEIRNEGFLSSIEGSIVLMAPQIRNLGSIVAKAGTVLLASGNHITLDFVGDGLVQFAVEGSLKDALIEHLGHIKGSIVSLKLPTAKQAIQEIVNLEGMQEGDVFVEENGIIKFVAASSLVAEKIHLEASKLSIEGSIKGNEVRLLGKDIFLQGAEIDVSSPQGGGKVLIGGEYQGKGTTPYAQTLTMDETSSILANALENGDGGLVVLWSKDRTIFNGAIEAHGGPLGGNGGQVETSSLDQLGIRKGSVTALAPKGKIGDWLLDPSYVHIYEVPSGSPTCSFASNTWGDCVVDGMVCDVDVASINAAAATVTIDATVLILVSTAINMTTSGAGIILGGCSSPATQSIELYGDISTNSGPITLAADAVEIAVSCSIDSAGGGGNGANISCLNTEMLGGVSGVSLTINGGTAGTVTLGTTTIYPLTDIIVSGAYQIKTPGLGCSGNLTLNATNGVLASGSTTNLSSSGGNVTIGTTVDAQDGSSYILNIATSVSTGIISVSGAIGGTSPLASVSISGTGSASFNSITTKTNGAINISAPAIFNQNSVIASNGGAISFSSALSDITAGGNTLQLIAGTGVITLSSDIGAFGSFTITSAGTLNLAGSITAYDLVSIAPTLTLAGSSTIEIQTTSGDISLAGVTSSTTQDFTCVSSGDTTVGALTSLGDVNISAATIHLTGAITATSLTLFNSGTLTVNAGTINLSGGDFNQSGGGGVTLSTTTITSNNGGISFAGALSPSIAGTSNLTINAGTGLIALGGQVGTVGSAFGSVTITAASEVDLGSSIYATNAVSITPTIVLSGASTIQSLSGTILLHGVSSSKSSSLICFAGTTLSVGALSGLGNSTLTGTAVTLGGTVTNSAALTITDSTSLSIIAGDIDITGSFTESGGGSVSLGKNITAGGGISFADAILYNSTGNFSLTASGSPGIVLSSNVTGAGAGYNLTLTSYAYGIDAVANLGTAGASLGNVTLLSNVASTFAGIAATGSIDVEAPIILNAATTVQVIGGGSAANSVTFASTVDSASGTHYALTITAAATPIVLNSTLGFTTPLGAVTISGTANLSLGSSIDTYGGIVTLNPPVVLTAASIIDTTFASASGANIVLGSTVDGAEDLMLKAGDSGSITFGGAVGGNTPLASLLIEFASVVNAKNIKTTGDITIDPPVILSNASTAISSTANGEISLGKIDGTTSGSQSLTVTTTDIVTLGLVGSSVSLGNLTVTSSYAKIQSITVTGTVDIDAITTLAQSSTITGATLLLGMINGLTTGGQNLVLVGGAITLSEGLGVLIPLSAVTISGSSLDLGSSIYTYAQGITINAPITLSADSTLDTTDDKNAPVGSTITIGAVVNGAQNFILKAGTSGVVTVSANIGATTPLTSLLVDSASTVHIKNVTTTGSITSSPSIILSNALTTLTSNSGGSIALGSIDGTALSSQSLTVATTGAIALGVIGNSVPLVNVTALTGTKATIHSILVSGLITIDIPIVLAASATLNTTKNGSTGSNLTLQAINGKTVGGESLTITMGTTGAVVFAGNIGSSSTGNPIGSLDVTGASITFEGSTVVTKGSETYHSPVLISEDITFTSLGNITFDSTVSPVSGSPSMTFYPGSGALTFAAALTSFNNIIVRNAGSFSAQAISVNDLVVAGGQPSIFINGTVTLGTPGVLVLDGGPIYLGAQIDAKFLFMHSEGNISNIGLPQPINISTTTLRNFEVFNATNGVIGSIDSPIEINTPYSIVVGADSRADFSGTPNHTQVKELPSNPPCVVTFNGVTLIDCGLAAPSNRFPFLPKYLFYVPGLYSSWDNLSNWEYFEAEPWALGANPRDMKLMVRIPSRVSKEEKVHRTLQSRSRKASKKTATPRSATPQPQPVVPQPVTPQPTIPQPAAQVKPEEVKSPKVIVNVQVITPTPSKQDSEQKIEKPSVSEMKALSSLSIPTNIEQKVEQVDWEFSLDFGKETKALDVLFD